MNRTANTPQGTKKFITLREWDEATTQQRTFWLENVYLLSQSDGEALSARIKSRSGAYRDVQQLGLPCGTIQPPEWMLGESEV